MAITIHLHIAIFIPTQSNIPACGEAPANPAVWLMIQPYVPRSALAGWAKAAAAGIADSSLQFAHVVLDESIFKSSSEETDPLIPVPLAPDISLDLERRDGAGAPLGARLLNDRGGAIVTDPDGFRADNVKPQKLTDAKQPMAAVAAGPYSLGLMRGVLALAAEGDLDSLVNWLRIAFLVGSPLRLRPATVARQDAVQLFDVTPRQAAPEVAGTVRLVSKHSLCGQMFRLDAGIGTETLTQLKSLKLTLRRASGALKPAEAVDLGPEETYTVVLANGLTDALARLPTPAQRWAPALLAGMNQRVYVTRHRSALAEAKFASGVGGGTSRLLYQRANSAQIDMRLSQIEDLSVFQEAGAMDSDPAELKIRFYDTLELELVPYRSALPAAAQPRGLWQLLPGAATRRRFIAVFDAIARSGPADWPPEFTLHDASGNRIVKGGNAIETGFVGSYLLPWDDVGNTNADLGAGPGTLPTVLFWFENPGVVLGAGITPDVMGVTLLMRIPGQLPVLKRQEFEGVSTGGARWRGEPGALPDVHWSALEVLADGALPAKLTPAFCRKGDYVLQPAQSARFLEGVLRVDYQQPPGNPNANAVDAVYEVLRGSVEYLKLNEYYQDGAAGGCQPVVPLNPWSSRPPVYGCKLSACGVLTHTFHYRHMLDPYGAASAGAAREHYRRTYAHFGGERETILDIEHITGHQFEIMRDKTRIAHDLPPLLPTALRHESAAAKQVTPPSALMTVEFLPAAAPGGAEKVRIAIDARYLDASKLMQLGGIDQVKAEGYAIQAWRSVAEMAHAKKLQLRGRFLRFDFAGAVREAQATRQPLDLHAALIPVATPDESHVLADLAALRASAARWLEGVPPAPGELVYETSLSLPAGVASIAGACHVAEFRVELVREDGTLPPAAGWTFLRPYAHSIPVDDAYDANGERFETIADPGLLAALDKIYRGKIVELSGVFDGAAEGGNGWRSIAPVAAHKARAASLQALLGSGRPRGKAGQAAERGGSVGDWIMPGGIASAGDAVGVAVVPMGFRPLVARHQGVASQAALYRYAAAIDLVINAAPAEWNLRHTLKDWRDWYAKLAAQSGNVARVASAARKLVVPAYLPGQNQPNMSPQVAALLADLQAGRGGTAGWHAHLGRLFLSRPRLFAESRALLLTRLRSATRLPPSLLRLRMRRAIAAKQCGAGAEAGSDFEQANLQLADALPGDAGESAIAFVEVLGGGKYDGEFSIADVEVDGLENLLAPALAPVPPLPVDGPHVPAIRQDGNCLPEVRLPSREPLVDSVYVISAALRGTEKPGFWEAFKPGATLSLDDGQLATKQAIVTKKPSDGGYVLRCWSRGLDRSSQRDRVVVSTVYFVTSDEDNRFVNDAFRFTASKIAGGELKRQAVPGGDAAGLFRQLEQEVSLYDIQDLKFALDDTATAMFEQALAPAVPPQRDQGWLAIGVTGNDGAGALDVPAGYAAYLFTPARTPAVRASGPTRHLLMIQQEVPIWRDIAFSFYQTRNHQSRDTPQALALPFNEQVWQFGNLVGDVEGVRLRADVVERQGPFTLQQRKWDAAKLVEALLVKKGILSTDADGTGWTSHDLSVLVSAVQTTAFPVLTGAPENVEMRTMEHGTLPLWNAMVRPGAAEAADRVEFDPAWLEFTLDFTWTDTNNTEVLRIQDVHVRFSS